MSFFLSPACSVFVLYTVTQVGNSSCRTERTGEPQGSQRKIKNEGMCICCSICVCCLSVSCECRIFSLHFLSTDDPWPKAELHFHSSLGFPYLCTWYFVIQFCVYVYIHIYISITFRQVSCFNLLKSKSNLGIQNLHFVLLLPTKIS